MNDLLLELYLKFFEPDHDEDVEEEISQCYSELKELLSKEDRKLVLRIIDDKDWIAWEWSFNSFITGFHLAWSLSAELSALPKPWLGMERDSTGETEHKRSS